MSQIGTVAGTTIGISAFAPLTYNSGGYRLLNFTKIGNIEDAGEHGRSYTEFTFETIGIDGVRKYKDTHTEGSKVLVIGYDSSDAGLAILNQALYSKSDYSFAVTYPTGNIDYFRAKVLRFVKSSRSVNSMRTVTVGLSITSTVDEIGIVEYQQFDLALQSGGKILQENDGLILVE
jgi:hypothetical protein